MDSFLNVKAFADALALHNPGYEFELCITHDNRDCDDSRKDFDELKKQYPFVKVARNTKANTIQYLRKMLSYYGRYSFFTPQFRKELTADVDAYEAGELFDESKTFLWLSSGWLYNMAVSISTGDNLIVSPCDYIYFYKLDQIDKFIKKQKKRELFYGKPNALRGVKLTNLPPGIPCPPSKHHGRDKSRSTNIEDLYVSDIKNSFHILVADPSFFNKVGQLATKLANKGQQGKRRMTPSYHGHHIMTKTTYDYIGGFTEAFYGRAWADDKMGLARNERVKLPPRFSFPLTAPYKPAASNPVYLGESKTQSEANIQLASSMRRKGLDPAKPVRF